MAEHRSADCGIIGGGAAGLAAAAFLSCLSGGTVSSVILEKGVRVGRKLLATGNGTCNLSNIHAAPPYYHGAEPDFARPALSAFPPEEATAFFTSIGVECHQREDGRIYPLCAQAGVSGAPVERLCRAVGLYGPLAGNLDALREMYVNSETERALRELTELAGVLGSFGALGSINLDLSITSDTDYYNGLLFKGYVPGAPSAVLSGGRYDSLLTKLGKSGGAIGFAVYLNLLERLYEPDGDGYAADVLLLPGGAAPSALAAAAKAVTDSGRSVLVQGAAGARCRRTARINAEGGLEYLD